LCGSDASALAVSKDRSRVYAVVLTPGNQTTDANPNVILGTQTIDRPRLQQLGLNPIACSAPHPPYPPLPPGITRDTQLPDPPNGGVPPVGLIVKWDPATQKWRDDAGQDWSMCLPFRLPDHDLFIIDVASPQVTGMVDHLAARHDGLEPRRYLRVSDRHRVAQAVPRQPGLSRRDRTGLRRLRLRLLAQGARRGRRRRGPDRRRPARRSEPPVRPEPLL